ncbi:MAG: HAMP domain-containing histidine kinase [Deltaproteobacteria bacterium]|nr:MAG: HAMP domain-containing histidine kinase [Deltaproteobacteria bacterium]
MRLGFRGKLFLVSVGLMLVVGSISGLYLERRLRMWFAERLEQDLLQQVKTVRLFLEKTRPGTSIQSVDRALDQLSATSKARLTVIRKDGRVLGDSWLKPDKIRTLDNHRLRPEIQATQTKPFGSSTRYSDTLKTKMLYVAVPYQLGLQQGVIRAALPLKEVEGVVHRLRLLILFAGLVGLAVAIFMSFFASSLIARSLRSLVRSTRAVAQKGEHPLIQIKPGDELAGLAGSLDRLANELETTVTRLAEERNRFEAVLESMNAAVLTYDAEQKIVLVNRSAASVLHLDTMQVGRDIFTLVRSSELRQLVADVEQGNSATTEIKLDEPSRTLLVRATPLSAAGGGVMVFHDITELRRLETIRRDFVANVSHELRTPVSIIRANAETLLDGALEDPDFAQDFLEALSRNAERLSNLISDLLDISRIEAGEYELNMANVSISRSIRTAVETVKAMLRNKNIEIEVELNGDLEAASDERALEHILLNYLDNAIKYTPEQGKIIVRGFRSEPNTIRVEVQDNGPGIAAKHRSRIFERFYRVDKGRSRHMGGTGLGLAIVRHLTESMGGSVGLDPAKPTGSIFWFTVPVEETVKNESEDPEVSPLQVPPSSSVSHKPTHRKPDTL